MHLRTHCALAALIASAAPASAVLVQLEATGEISSLEGAFDAPLDMVAPGQPWRMTILYETDTDPVSSSPTTATYFPVDEIEVFVDGVDVTPFGASSGTIASIADDFESADPTMDRDELAFAFTDDIDVALGMIDYDQEALDSTDLPTMLDFSAFDESAFIIRSGSSMDDSRIEGTVSDITLTVIPAPGAAIVFFMAAMPRRRR